MYKYAAGAIFTRRGGAQASEGRLLAALREEVAAAEARAEEERAAAADARRAAARREHELEARALCGRVRAPASPTLLYVCLTMSIMDLQLSRMGCGHKDHAVQESMGRPARLVSRTLRAAPA
jgi:hypothetical protein